MRKSSHKLLKLSKQLGYSSGAESISTFKIRYMMHLEITHSIRKTTISVVEWVYHHSSYSKKLKYREPLISIFWSDIREHTFFRTKAEVVKWKFLILLYSHHTEKHSWQKWEFPAVSYIKIFTRVKGMHTQKGTHVEDLLMAITHYNTNQLNVWLIRP